MNIGGITAPLFIFLNVLLTCSLFLKTFYNLMFSCGDEVIDSVNFRVLIGDPVPKGVSVCNHLCGLLFLSSLLIFFL